MTRFDAVVVGHGLAGAAVAWQLRWLGRRVLVVDAGDPDAASRVAAGLVTPATGRRRAAPWRFDEFWPAALAFYRRVEAETGRKLFDERPAARLVEGEEVELAPAGRLDVPAYLAASRLGDVLTTDLDPADVVPEPDGVRLPMFGVMAGAVVFCQGWAGRTNPWFPNRPFSPAKGEVLTLRIPELVERRTLHGHGVWLAPAGGDLFLAGSTYNRDDLTATPTAAGRCEIVGKLRQFLWLPFEVIDHRAAVRPTTVGVRPLSGVHPRYPRLAYLNGLGSKGVLMAPLLAAELVEGLPC